MGLADFHGAKTRIHESGAIAGEAFVARWAVFGASQIAEATGAAGDE